jgi:hypothetical protein
MSAAWSPHQITTLKLNEAVYCMDCRIIHNGPQCPYCAASVHNGHLVLSTVLDRVSNVGKRKGMQR